jgi:hypothetical protein
MEGAAGGKAATSSRFLSVVPGVGPGRIAVAPDPGLVEHDPGNETHHAHESEEADDDHVGPAQSPPTSGRS